MHPPSIDDGAPGAPPMPFTGGIPGGVPGGDPAAHAAAHAAGAPCPECASRARQPLVEQFVYAIGRLDVRFPSLGIEREYQQRERALGALEDLQALPRTARLRAVLDRFPHLALRMGYVFLVGGTPVYAVAPAGGHLRESLFAALAQADEKGHHTVLIGRVTGFGSAPTYGGLLLTAVTADQLYDFGLDAWSQGLAATAQAALKARKIDADRFDGVARSMFRELSSTPDNLGGTDGHRALNYLLVQHPGLFLAAAERRDHVLDHVETRVVPNASGRRHVLVVLTFLDRTTGVPERLYTSVDVTEEWPFVVGSPASGAPLGLAPFIDMSVTLSA